MPQAEHYRDSARENKPERSDNWKHLGALALSLAAKAGGAK